MFDFRKYLQQVRKASKPDMISERDIAQRLKALRNNKKMLHIALASNDKVKQSLIQELSSADLERQQAIKKILKTLEQELTSTSNEPAPRLADRILDSLDRWNTDTENFRWATQILAPVISVISIMPVEELKP